MKEKAEALHPVQFPSAVGSSFLLIPLLFSALNCVVSVFIIYFYSTNRKAYLLGEKINKNRKRMEFCSLTIN